MSNEQLRARMGSDATMMEAMAMRALLERNGWGDVAPGAMIDEVWFGYVAKASAEVLS